MQIRKFTIDNHRCLVDFEINFETMDGGSSTILIGENGTGKSTMMESLLEIMMSFDSDAVEKTIDYNYTLEYVHAGQECKIECAARRYTVYVDEIRFAGTMGTIRGALRRAQKTIFPERVMYSYSGKNDRLIDARKNINSRYLSKCRDALKGYGTIIRTGVDGEYMHFPKRRFNYCDDALTPVFLAAILGGQDSLEKEYLHKNSNFSAIDHISLSVDMDEMLLRFGIYERVDEINESVYSVFEYMNADLCDFLRRSYEYSAMGRAYFGLGSIEELGLNAIEIYNFFEKLQSLFKAEIEVSVSYGNESVKCAEMSEGQRQFIKVLGMLGLCKSEDCIVFMDEPDAHMNPRWKYELKSTIDACLTDAVNTQAIIATHDPLVINGVSKEFIRIFTQNKTVAQYNNMYISKVIEPSEDTTGMGIDGLLQSEYYGMPSVLDTNTREKLHEKYDLVVKKQEQRLDENEAARLKALTEELESMIFARNMPTDEYYDEFVAAMHKIYRDNRAENLTAEAIEERNTKAEEILREIFGI